MNEQKANLFLVGAPKCGTTAMASYLSSHREVFSPKIKEPQFFADDFPTRIIYSRTRYDDLYRDANHRHKWRLDASTIYIYSETAVKNIVQFNEEATFVVMIRDPMTMTPSWYNQMRLRFFEDAPNFEAAWSSMEHRRNGIGIPARCSYPRFLMYDEIALYGQQIANMFEFVPRDRVHVIVYDDLRDDPMRVYYTLLRFLGLPIVDLPEFIPQNTRKAWKLPWLGRLAGLPPLRRARLAMGLALNGNEKFASWLFRGAPVEPLSPTLAGRVQAAYTEDVNKVEAFLGRALPSWLSAPTGL